MLYLSSFWHSVLQGIESVVVQRVRRLRPSELSASLCKVHGVVQTADGHLPTERFSV